MKNNLVLLLIYLLGFHTACQSQSQNKNKALKQDVATKDSIIILPKQVEPIHLSEQQWKSKLNEESYYVLRQKGTERAFTGTYWDNHATGIYFCKACQLPLFSSETKFESGTGWPSFTQPLRKDVVREISDNTHGMRRTEVVCSRCEGHLGHVFEDGPEPTGLRYCMNSVSLDFRKGAKVK